LRKRLKKKLEQRNNAMMFTLSRKGKPYPVPVFSRREGDFKIDHGKLMKWARKRIDTYKRIDYTDISPDIYVSTVFLGINHNFRYTTPILFETMIFGGEYDRAQWRYTNIKEARRGHREAVELVRRNDDNRQDGLENEDVTCCRSEGDRQGV
jgi:hypothetical protein